MNTEITYLYRDAENYKKWNTVIINNLISMDDILPFLFEKQFFIPSEIGFPDLNNHKFRHYDHVWHEIFEVLPTSVTASLPIDAIMLIAAFRKAYIVNWKVTNILDKKMFSYEA